MQWILYSLSIPSTSVGEKKVILNLIAISTATTASPKVSGTKIFGLGSPVDCSHAAPAAAVVFRTLPLMGLCPPYPASHDLV